MDSPLETLALEKKNGKQPELCLCTGSRSKGDRDQMTNPYLPFIFCHCHVTRIL